MNTPAATKTDLLLLGLLLDRPMHGYEIYQTIQNEGIDGWFSISAAGVYYSLRKLHEQGLVVESRQRRGGSASKSIYRLTGNGRSAFMEAMDVELASQEEPCLDYDLAIYLLNKVPVQRALPPLERREAWLARQTGEVRAAISAKRAREGSPLKLAILDHKLRYLEMEKEWLAGVAASVRQESEVRDEPDDGRQRLMVLNGNLRGFHLPDLLYLIISGQHSGTLRITDGVEVRNLVFAGGKLECAGCHRWGAPPGSVPLSCEEVVAGLCEVFRWQEGRFTFDQTVEHGDGCIPLDCSIEELILRGCRKVDSWSIIQQLVPSDEIIFEAGPAAHRVDQLGLTEAEERIVAAVDGVSDVAAIARELDLTLFEASRSFYCLTAIGVLQTADLDKILLRRVFREITEWMCRSTVPWRSSPDDRECEKEVNERTRALPIALDNGRIQDRVDREMKTDELKELYTQFLTEQYTVVSRRFGRTNAQRSFEQALHQLAPELQAVAKRYGLDRLSRN
jgi:DNA-binding PadR family transcriptional regulator